MWFKKKSVLQAEHHYDTEKSADGTTDMRTTFKTYINLSSSINNSGLPSAADAGNYVYLPALGYCSASFLTNVGSAGFYWSSSAYPLGSGAAWGLGFGSGSVSMSNYSRSNGFRAEAFQ